MESPIECRVRVAGELGDDWTAWFDGLAVEPGGDGTTEISGDLPDQSALFGLLAAVRDLGIEILRVEARRRSTDTGCSTGTTRAERPAGDGRETLR